VFSASRDEGTVAVIKNYTVKSLPAKNTKTSRARVNIGGVEAYRENSK
jgi:hypothetical protein